jgi:hypothetical protein
MGEMKRAIAREEQAIFAQRIEKVKLARYRNSAPIIAAVRLARDPDICRPSPRLTTVLPAALGWRE